MLKIPRIALFQPDNEDNIVIKQCFQKRDYSIREVYSVEDACELTFEEGASFDALIVPLRLHDGSSAVSCCIQIKSEQVLYTTPLLVLSTSKDTPMLEAAYGAGADVVLTAPFDAELLYLQIGALSRLKRSFDESINKHYEGEALLHPVVASLHTAREGFLLFDTNLKILFANRAAKTMLGLEGLDNQVSLEPIAKQFGRYLKEHDSIIRSSPAGESILVHPSNFNVNLVRSDHHSFYALLRITSLFREGGQVIGYSTAITDLSEIHHLANTLLQGQRTRSLFLMTSAAWVRFFESTRGSIVVSPLQYLDDYVREATRSCNLNSTLTLLLEILDLVMNPDTTVRLRVEQELTLAVQPTDFFQLLGHLILHAVEHAGIGGETLVHTTPNIPGEGVVITVTAESRRVVSPLAEDQMAKLISSDFSQEINGAAMHERLSLGLMAAQSIAERYRSKIEYQKPDESRLYLRIRLPVGRAVG